MKLRYLVPLVLFLVLAGFLAVGLQRNPREVPSPLVNKRAPEFSLPRLEDPSLQHGVAQMKGKVWVANFFASWCVPCLAEHPLVTELSRSVTVVGINYKDKREDATRWLARNGNSYAMVLVDREGKVGLDYGVYGVPESYVIDKDGVIRYKQIGPITPQALQEVLLPLLKKLDA
ncbi:MAG TPA: DsbE family thiol:disulfide interchange protein [Rubrivivax sp.]|nr:DsbE family thiol:disulfide interchange protein [Burkholderiales bacterium]HNT38737.1 DsbE family thiol:disulfide interchange protein [Rubrivivax sp.]